MARAEHRHRPRISVTRLSMGGQMEITTGWAVSQERISNAQEVNRAQCPATSKRYRLEKIFSTVVGAAVDAPWKTSASPSSAKTAQGF
ncbi:MAG: hypothetical protein O7C65_09645 [Planctomycetota bacterium]|nr:hypothetical protein [Planctomycetota bacterium]